MLTWLLGQPRANEILDWMQSAEVLWTSELTLLECYRALVRLESDGEDVEAYRARLHEMACSWVIRDVTSDVLMSAAAPFRREWVRSLDGIHLATALEVQGLAGESVVLVTLDRRMRLNGIAHGFEVAPLPTTEEWKAAEGSLWDEERADRLYRELQEDAERERPRREAAARAREEDRARNPAAWGVLITPWGEDAGEE